MSLTIEEEINNQRKKNSHAKQIWILLVISFFGIFIMLIFLFILIRNIPGSPYTMPLNEISSQAAIDLWGLDKTPFQQFFIFLGNIISGNWGESLIISSGIPVKDKIVVVLPRFLEFNFISFCFSLPLGVIFGIWAFKFKDKWKGIIPKAIKRLNWAIFVVGLGIWLQYTFGYRIGLLPSKMYYDVNMPTIPKITHFRLIDTLLAGNWAAWWDQVLHLVMPVFCLSFIMVSFISEMTYSMIDFYKSGKDIPFLSGKIGFYLSLIFTYGLLIDVTFGHNSLSMLVVQSIYAKDLFIASVGIYLIFLIFIVINISINILLYLIPIVIEFRKKSKIAKKEAESTNSTESVITDSISKSPETVKEPNMEESALVLDKDDENTKSISKGIFHSLKRKLINPLTILGIILIGFIIVLAIFAASLSPYDYELVQGIDYSVAWYDPPSSDHIFGVTKFGRDVLSRCLYGIQNAVKMGFISTIIGMPLGVLIGMISAFYGKWVKYIIDTTIGMILFIPGSIFVFSIVSVAGNDFSDFYWIYGLISLPIATLFTQQALSFEMKKGAIIPRDFTKPNGRKIVNRLPNIILSILGVGCLLMGLTILIFEGMDYLGVGDYSVIGLGTDINIGRSRLTTAPWATFWPAFWIFIVVLGFIMLGSGLKEEE
jgi:peptide/nickel transport system permease protein